MLTPKRIFQAFTGGLAMMSLSPMTRTAAQPSAATPFAFDFSPLTGSPTSSVPILPSPAFRSANASMDSLQLPGNVATDWFNVLTNLTQVTPGDSPPVAPRALAYAAVALYETVVPGVGDGASLVGQLNNFTVAPTADSGQTYDWVTAANEALRQTSLLFFPNATAANVATINTLANYYIDTCRGQHSANVCDVSRSFGSAVANAVYTWSIGDGQQNATASNSPTSYVPPQGPGLWTPTPQNDQSAPLSALQPYWGYTRPFVAGDSTQCDPGPPLTFSTSPNSAFYAQVRQVYDTVNNLTPDEIAAARFWADDAGATPTNGGHVVAVLTQVLTDTHATLSIAAEAYARVNIAVADGFIAAWSTKYTYNLLRPVTYIQEYIDDGWLPFLNTPPFPEYVSGHSVAGGAGFPTMTTLFGSNYSYVDRTQRPYPFGVTGPRSFTSFDAAAQDDAMSRLYGGVHYYMSIALGVQQGQCVAQRVNSLSFRYAA